MLGEVQLGDNHDSLQDAVCTTKLKKWGGEETAAENENQALIPSFLRGKPPSTYCAYTLCTLKPEFANLFYGSQCLRSQMVPMTSVWPTYDSKSMGLFMTVNTMPSSKHFQDWTHSYDCERGKYMS